MVQPSRRRDHTWIETERAGGCRRTTRMRSRMGSRINVIHPRIAAPDHNTSLRLGSRTNQGLHAARRRGRFNATSLGSPATWTDDGSDRRRAMITIPTTTLRRNQHNMQETTPTHWFMSVNLVGMGPCVCEHTSRKLRPDALCVCARSVL